MYRQQEGRKLQTTQSSVKKLLLFRVRAQYTEKNPLVLC